MLNRILPFVCRLFGTTDSVPAGLVSRETPRARPVITVEDVRRANQRLIEDGILRSHGIHVPRPDTYRRLGLTPPTREEIEAAGAKAMRAVRAEQAQLKAKERESRP